MQKFFKQPPFNLLTSLLAASLFIQLVSCNSSSGTMMPAQSAPALPVLTLTSQPATTYREFSASLEGTKDIEIRPQVDGIIEKIYVDEGAYVRKGQPLFRINERTYREQYNNAVANLSAARANLANAQISVSKLTPLVENNVISDVQLKTAKASYNAAAAQVAQASALVRNTQISLGYTLIKAPADGYVGRIPLKTGSLVGLTTAEPLTVLSEIKDIYAYFSMSENDFVSFLQTILYKIIGRGLSRNGNRFTYYFVTIAQGKNKHFILNLECGFLRNHECTAHHFWNADPPGVSRT